MGKDHLFQPFDFFTSRKTKRFFKEDFVNLTQAITNKDYITREYSREVNETLPDCQHQLFASEVAYKEYLTKKKNTTSPTAVSTDSGGPYASVR